MSENEDNKPTKKRKEKVLVYYTEKGETTRCFIEDLKKYLVVFEFQDFHDANVEDKDTLSIIVVVRHTSIRVTETVSEVKEQFDKKNIKDLKRVFVIYFYVNKSDEGCKHDIKQISDSGHFNFAKIVPMNFIYSSLYHKKLGFSWLRPDNKESLKELKDRILSRKKLCVNVYGAVDLPRVKAFIAKLDQNISSSIELQAVKPLKEPIDVTSPTLICTTGDMDEFQEKLKERDLKKVFLVHIIDVVKRSEIRDMHDSPDDMENTSVIPNAKNPNSKVPVGATNNTAQNAKNMPCEMYDLLHYNGHFTSKFYLDLTKPFEAYVRRWPVEIKPSSE